MDGYKDLDDVKELDDIREGSNYIGYIYSDGICLDGNFTADQLRRIADAVDKVERG